MNYHGRNFYNFKFRQLWGYWGKIFVTLKSLPPRVTSGRGGSGHPQRQITNNDIDRTANEYLDDAGKKESQLTVDELRVRKFYFLFCTPEG